MKIITFDNVSFGYEEGLFTLKNISFDLDEGDYVGITGPNGGGKTTILKLALGLLRCRSGKITIKDNVAISYMPQQTEIDKMFPIQVEDVIWSGLLGLIKPNNIRTIMTTYKQRFDSLVERLHITDILRKDISGISGGQFQKTLLCRALISSPDVLLLDEPNTYLDRESEVELLKFIKEDATLKSAIIVTHDITTISEYINKHAVVDNASLVFVDVK